MLQATEQQLQVVTRKVQRLEASVQTQIEALKSIRSSRNEAIAKVEALREELARAEDLADRLSKDHDDSQAALKQTAEEYGAAQILQKKYQNAVSMLLGQCRSFVKLIGGNTGSQQFVVADECTINAVERKKSFVVDGVLDETCNTDEQLDATMNISNMVADVLGGYNTSIVTFGPSLSGKTSALFGNIVGLAGHNEQQHNPGRFGVAAHPAGESVGVVERFVHLLFGNLEANEVTHFNIRCSFAELTQEQLVDLLSEYGNVSSVLGYRGASGNVHQTLSDLSAVQVQTANDVLQLIHTGWSRCSHGKSKNGIRLGSHLFLAITVENFNTRGHFRRATATFVDLAGSQSQQALSQQQSSQQQLYTTPEQQWVNKSLSCVCDVISMLSAANQQQLQSTGQCLAVPIADTPHRHNRLIQLLKDTIGGNSKSVLLCCVNARVNSIDEILSALTYSLHFKFVKNFCIPYDIPPELQRLNLQMNRFQED